MPFAQEILLPVDFSASSLQLAPAVAAVAKGLAAPITLLHVVPAVADSSIADRLVREASQKLAAFGTAALAGLTVRHEVSSRPPASAIVGYSQKMPTPLIMIPTHGENTFRRLLLGSVTAAVLHDAECPVWTSAHCEDGGPLPVEYKSVVCGIDLGSSTPEVLRQASAFAVSFGAELHVVHSVPGIDPMFESATANRAHTFLVNSARDAYPEIVRSAGVELPPLEVVEQVGLAEGIAAAAGRHRADLLVIGRGVMQGVLGRLRTNAHELIRKSPCPVLSV